MMTFFRARGYATEARAKALLESWADALEGYSHFVAAQNGRFYPVVILNDRAKHPLPIPSLAAVGITIVS